jgi:hypothetical protein
MSIDKFHFVRGENTTDIEHTEAAVSCWKKETHTIYVMWGGVEHLYIFEDGAQAAETFERWRSQPCEKIVLTLDGVPQASDRLPVNSVDTGCDMDISWDGEYATDGDPNGPARWQVRCGRPVAGEVKGRPFCQKHVDADGKVQRGKLQTF